MKISYQWLREWVATELTAADAGEKLTMAGLELEGIEAAAPPLDGVVVARIISAEKHPDADRLQVCQVDAGQDEPLQIVCGAPNARAGLNVALATIGTRLPGDFKIKKGKIRGQVSFGMLCSGAELGMEGSDGIIELPDHLTIGTSLTQALNLDDEVLEIALTPNRGDCFSVRGVARDLACVTQSTWSAPFTLSSAELTIDDKPVIAIEDAKDCRRYAGRIVRGLNRQAPTPDWMSERLRRSGLRSINPLVDVTNYVLLELGQPMHAFDLGKINGEITVRRGLAKETLTLLNEQEIELDAQSLVIADANGPVALAGAMGGLHSSVDDDTVDVLLESACFTPQAVAGTGRRFKLSSDSLQRFERGVDPCLQEQALERATALLLEICGGQAGPITLCEADAWQAPRITLDPARVQSLLGKAIDPVEMKAILERLECQVSSDGELFTVDAPSHRYDLLDPIDLVEEIARVHGYDELPGKDRRIAPKLSSPRPQDRALARMRNELVARGYHEVVSFSFADETLDDALCGDAELSAVKLDNPMSNAMAQMRRTTWSSLLPIWQHNSKRQQARVRLFELGRRYGRRNGQLEEIEVVAGLVSGLAQIEQWSLEKRAVDFYDLKADVMALIAPIADRVVWSSEQLHPALHPGRSAALVLNDQVIGHVGQIHPKLQKQFKLPGSPLLFEIERDSLTQEHAPELHAITTSPSSRFDLSMLVNQSLESDKLIRFVKSVAGSILREVVIFDVFTGDALPQGLKSVALGLIFQDFSRTLTDQEVETAVAELTSELEKNFGAQIRDSRGAD